MAEAAVACPRKDANDERIAKWNLPLSAALVDQFC